MVWQAMNASAAPSRPQPARLMAAQKSSGAAAVAVAAMIMAGRTSRWD
jgi:hypothetical protein